MQAACNSMFILESNITHLPTHCIVFIVNYVYFWSNVHCLNNIWVLSKSSSCYVYLHMYLRLPNAYTLHALIPPLPLTGALLVLL